MSCSVVDLQLEISAFGAGSAPSGGFHSTDETTQHFTIAIALRPPSPGGRSIERPGIYLLLDGSSLQVRGTIG